MKVISPTLQRCKVRLNGLCNTVHFMWSISDKAMDKFQVCLLLGAMALVAKQKGIGINNGCV